MNAPVKIIPIVDGITPIGMLAYEFEELFLLTEDGAEMLPVDGEAEIEYCAPNVFEVREISLRNWTKGNRYRTLNIREHQWLWCAIERALQKSSSVESAIQKQMEWA